MGLNFNKTQFEVSYANISQLDDNKEDMEIVFAGRSNVGKSSLLNKLFQRKSLARTSSKPGKTATINFYRVEKDVVFVDLPGYGYAKVSKEEKKKWDELISKYLFSDRNIMLITLLIDARHAPSELDVKMINSLVFAELPFIIALTKKDKLKPKQYEKRMAAFKTELPYYEDLTIIETSSETGEGIDKLRETYNYVTEYS